VGILIKFANNKGVGKMPDIFDVANFFIDKAIRFNIGLTHMKLQKLVYYAQAWYLAWYSKPLFSEDFVAWQYGPVCPELYEKYSIYKSNLITIVDPNYNDGVFYKKELDALENVWQNYGEYDAYYLSEMTHREDPWKNSVLNEKILKNTIMEYYKTFC
jgi:uncharacterized phage-associated protein